MLWRTYIEQDLSLRCVLEQYTILQQALKTKSDMDETVWYNGRCTGFKTDIFATQSHSSYVINLLSTS